MSWVAEFCSASAPAVRLLDGAIRRWSRCWGGPGWPDAQRLITGRLLSLFGRIVSMPIGDGSPAPCPSRVMASFPGSLIASCSSSFGTRPVMWSLRLWGRCGVTRQPENCKRAHSRVPALQTPPGNGGSGRGKKEILGGPAEGPHPSRPHPSGPYPSGLTISLLV